MAAGKQAARRSGLWLPKAIYFLNTCAAVPWGRYKTIYYLSLGMSATQIGTVRSGALLAKLLGWPLWGAVADSTSNLRNTLVASVALATISLEYLRRVGVQAQLQGTSAVLHVIMIAAILRSALNAEWPLVDTMTLAMVQRHHAENPGSEDSEEGYGHQRLWAAVSWGGTSLVVGSVIDIFGLEMIFYLTYVIASLNCLLLLKYLPSDLVLRGNNDEVKSEMVPESLPTRLRYFLSRWSVLCFLFNIFCYSVIHSIPEQILFLQMDSEFHSSRTLQGAAVAASVVTEVPVMYMADRLLAKHGTQGLILRAQLVCAVRLFAYALVPTTAAWLVLPIQLLHGLSFGLLWVAAVHHAQRIALPGLHATSQSVMCAVWGTLGQAVGGVLWGVMYDTWGPRAVYLSGSLAALLLAVIGKSTRGCLDTPHCTEREGSPVADDMEVTTPIFGPQVHSRKVFNTPLFQPRSPSLTAELV